MMRTLVTLLASYQDAVVYFLAHLMDYYGTGPSVDSANAAVDIHGNTLNLDDVHGSGFAFDRHAIVQFLPGQGDQGMCSCVCMG